MRDNEGQEQKQECNLVFVLFANYNCLVLMSRGCKSSSSNIPTLASHQKSLLFTFDCCCISLYSDKYPAATSKIQNTRYRVLKD